MTESLHLPLLLARWLDARLHESVGFCLRNCRLYGVEVIDVAGLQDGEPLAARMSFIAEAGDRESVVGLPEARRALDFDAVAMVVVEWRPSAVAAAVRPGEFAPRRRVRVVELILTADGGGANALRFEHEPDLVVLAPVP